MINSFGIALITKAALGISPISSVPYVLSLRFPLSFGTTTFIINMLFIIGQFLLLKKQLPPIQWLQIGVNLIFSGFIDVSMNLLSWLNPLFWWDRGLSLLLGCLILAFGISIEVAPGVLLVPGEGLVKAISLRCRHKFGTIKICFDLSLVIIAAIMSFIFFQRLEGIGIGTAVSALLVGKVVNIFNKRLPLIKKISSLNPLAQPQQKD